MRYMLKMESIGDFAAKSAARRWVRGREINKRDLFLLQNAQKLKTWVAEIVGIDSKYGFARNFLAGQKDYSEAGGVGNRGVWFYYWLKPGIYEINQRVSVKVARRYFLHVIDHQTSIEITKEEVLKAMNESKEQSAIELKLIEVLADKYQGILEQDGANQVISELKNRQSK